MLAGQSKIPDNYEWISLARSAGTQPKKAKGIGKSKRPRAYKNFSLVDQRSDDLLGRRLNPAAWVGELIQADYGLINKMKLAQFSPGLHSIVPRQSPQKSETKRLMAPAHTRSASEGLQKGLQVIKERQIARLTEEKNRLASEQS